MTVQYREGDYVEFWSILGGELGKRDGIIVMRMYFSDSDDYIYQIRYNEHDIVRHVGKSSICGFSQTQPKLEADMDILVSL